MWATLTDFSMGEVDLEELKKKIEQAKELQAKLRELGVKATSTMEVVTFLEMSRGFSEIRSEVSKGFSEFRNEISGLRGGMLKGFSSVNSKLSWLLGAISVAIGLLVVVVAAVL